MIGTKEHEVLHQFFKDVNVKEIEVYEELYDHIATSFEAREDPTEDIKAHIRNVAQPNLGGVDGINKILNDRKNAFQREVHGHALRIFQHYLLGWPGILITIATIILAIQLTNQFGNEELIFVSVSLPAIMGIIGIVCNIIAQSRAKKQKLGVKKSLKNRIIYRLISDGFFVTFCIHKLIEYTNQDWIQNIPVLTTLILVISIVYMLVCIRLVKEKFIFKLAL